MQVNTNKYLPYTENMLNVKTSLKIWVQFKQYFVLQSFSSYAPLSTNHVFPPSLSDSVFSNWERL